MHRAHAASAGTRPRRPSATPFPSLRTPTITWAVMMTLVQVVAQEVGPGRVAEFGHGLGLDLADALPGHAVDLADLVQGLGLAVGQAEPHRDHAGLALGQRVQDRV